MAVGIASVVALGLVGANFQSTLTANAQKQNRGDLSVSPYSQGLTFKQYAVFSHLKAQGTIVDFQAVLFYGGSLRKIGGDSNNVVLSSLIGVDPSKFPFYDTVTADTPAGESLSRLMQQPASAVISQDAFRALHLRLGDRVRLSLPDLSRHIYRITGIVPDNAPDNTLGSGLFNDFLIVDRSTVLPFFRSQGVAANAVFVKTADAAQAIRVKSILNHQLGGLNAINTAADVEKNAISQSDSLNTFLRIMGLVAVIIGGIGIVNTMLVAARRRTQEIAVLKAMGMRARQVVFVFVLESLILAAVGSIVGVFLGIGVSVLVNRVAEGLAGVPLVWGVHAQPIVVGVLVGLVATLLFSYLPILRASGARPLAALRADTLALPRQHWYVILPLILMLAAVMGYLAVLYAALYTGLRAVVYGAVGGIVVLAVSAFLIQFFSWTVWLVSKLPSLGRLSVRMAFRSMNTQRRRLGSTLLALTVGILAVSTVAIVAQNVKTALAQSIEHSQNFNVVLYSSQAPETVRADTKSLVRLTGVQYREVGAVDTRLALNTVDGVSTVALLQRALTTRDQHGHRRFSKASVGSIVQELQGVAGRDTRLNPYDLTMKAGRNLSRRDAGTNHMVVKAEMAAPLGIRLGSSLTFSEPGHTASFLVVGIAQSLNLSFFAANLADVAYLRQSGLTVPAPTHHSTYYLKIRDANVAGDVAALRKDRPSALVFDINSLVPLINRLIDKITLFPEIIAALALFSGAVIIANTVALSMLERRREIGVMKAVGATRRAILGFLLIENAIVGLVGALSGVLLAMVVALVVDQQFLHISPSYDVLTILQLLLLGVVLAMAASSLTAFPASGERPMTVLRYE